jgi:hypothetical protein
MVALSLVVLYYTTALWERSTCEGKILRNRNKFRFDKRTDHSEKTENDVSNFFIIKIIYQYILLLTINIIDLQIGL